MNTQHIQEVLETACDCDSTVWCLTYKKCHRKMLGFEPYITPPQEPVAWIYEFYADMGHKGLSFKEQPSAYNTPLYTVPPKREWVSLTDAEMCECYNSPNVGYAVEAKLKEKNT